MTKFLTITYKSRFDKPLSDKESKKLCVAIKNHIRPIIREYISKILKKRILPGNLDD